MFVDDSNMVEYLAVSRLPGGALSSGEVECCDILKPNPPKQKHACRCAGKAQITCLASAHTLFRGLLCACDSASIRAT